MISDFLSCLLHVLDLTQLENLASAAVKTANELFANSFGFVGISMPANIEALVRTREKKGECGHVRQAYATWRTQLSHLPL